MSPQTERREGDVDEGPVREAPIVITVNGQPHSASGPHVSALDRGFTLADGVFETMRVHHGKVFRLERHLVRLAHGLAALDIPPVPELRDWLRDALQKVRGQSASVRLTVTRGAGAPGVAPPIDARPTAIITINPFPAFPPSLYRDGLTLHVASGRRNERAFTAGIKTIAYTDSIAALLEARRAGADDALFLDTEEHCSEATASNLFVCTAAGFVTPPLSCGALPGVTRATVLELARTLDVPAEERAIGLDELGSANEAFLTSSLRGIAPAVRVGAREIGSGVPGPQTRRFSAAYLALVAEECGA